MIALIPFFPTPTWDLGFLDMTLDSWSALVTFGVIFGLEVGRARAIKLGLDIRDLYDGALFILAMGFFVGHLIHVIPYNMHMIDEDGWIVLLEVWKGFSSTGGFIGALLGSILFLVVIRKRNYWVHADTMMYCFPFGYVFGRLGCFTAHDHIGVPSTSFVAVDYPIWGSEECEVLYPGTLDTLPPESGALGMCVGPRLDMALLEACWLVVICGVFFATRNRKLPYGSYLALWCMMYSPMRFVLDSFRNQDLEGADVRYLGLTPAQYWAMTTFGLGLGLLLYIRRRPLVREEKVIVIDANAPVDSSDSGVELADDEHGSIKQNAEDSQAQHSDKMLEIKPDGD